MPGVFELAAANAPKFVVDVDGLLAGGVRAVRI
jgi:hypothetical protein